jgi:hypothetical protein
MVARQWMWFTGWPEGLGMEVLPSDAPLLCGLVRVKLIVQVEEE